MNARFKSHKTIDKLLMCRFEPYGKMCNIFSAVCGMENSQHTSTQNAIGLLNNAGEFVENTYSHIYVEINNNNTEHRGKNWKFSKIVSKSSSSFAYMCLCTFQLLTCKMVAFVSRRRYIVFLTRKALSSSHSYAVMQLCTHVPSREGHHFHNALGKNNTKRRENARIET